jgi:hypothetical protein
VHGGSAAWEPLQFAYENYLAVLLEHDPEKWKPVFGEDHAQTKRLESEFHAIEQDSRGRKPRRQGPSAERRKGGLQAMRRGDKLEATMMRGR